MKLNLLIDNAQDILSGYVNIDPYAPDNDPAGRKKADISDLSHTVDDGEATEIVAHEVLSYFPCGMSSDILNGWVKKLAYGGTITVSVFDHREISRAIMARLIDEDKANDLLHGTQKAQDGWDTVKASFHLTILVRVLESLGLRVTQKRVREFRAIVTAVRPT